MRALLFLLLLAPIIALGELRVGYYGGTFDPPTRGHRHFLERAIKEAHLDIVYIFPAVSTPKKPNANPYPFRRAMVRAMIDDMPNVLGPDAELEAAFARGRLPAEIETISKRHPKAKLFILTGDDVISRNYSQFISQNPAFKDVGVIVNQRQDTAIDKRENLNDFEFADRELIILSAGSDPGISSSMVRERYRLGQSTDKFLEPAVQKVIERNGLYPHICRLLF